MDVSALSILCQMIHCDLALSRLHDVSNHLDFSEFDSFYRDIVSLKSSISSVCDKYSKKSVI